MSKTPLSTGTPSPPSVVDSGAVAQVAQLSHAAPVPPQNLDAEESVLGAMMLSPGAIGAVSEILDAGDFYRESHAKIYRAALVALREGRAGGRDHARRRARGAKRARGGRRRGPRSTSSPRSSRRPRTPRTTRGSSARWRRCAGLIRAGSEIARLGWERPGETDDLVDRAEQILFDLSQERVTTEFSHIEELLKESFERITQLYEAGADVTGVAVRASASSTG